MKKLIPGKKVRFSFKLGGETNPDEISCLIGDYQAKWCPRSTHSYEFPIENEKKIRFKVLLEAKSVPVDIFDGFLDVSSTDWLDVRHSNGFHGRFRWHLVDHQKFVPRKLMIPLSQPMETIQLITRDQTPLNVSTPSNCGFYLKTVLLYLFSLILIVGIAFVIAKFLMEHILPYIFYIFVLKPMMD